VREKHAGTGNFLASNFEATRKGRARREQPRREDEREDRRKRRGQEKRRGVALSIVEKVRSRGNFAGEENQDDSSSQ